MTAHDDAFERERPRLLGLAYRILASRADAEDVVQETWIRWQRLDPDSIEREPALLTTMVTRLCLDRLRVLARRREDYVGTWLPEPVAVGRGPEESVELADSLTLGFLVLLDRLTAAERAALLLVDVFGESYAVAAVALGRSEGACRQLVSRARRRIRDDRPVPTEPVDGAVLGRLLAAVASGDHETTLELLDPEVLLLVDAGSSRRAARRPVMGADRVARFLINVARRRAVVEVEELPMNAGPAFVVTLDDGSRVAIGAEAHAGRITTIFEYFSEEKVRSLDDGTPMR